MYLVNLSEEDFIRKKNRWLAKIKQWIDQHDPGATLIPFSVPFEQKLRQMPADERAAFLDANKTAVRLLVPVSTWLRACVCAHYRVHRCDDENCLCTGRKHGGID